MNSFEPDETCNTELATGEAYLEVSDTQWHDPAMVRILKQPPLGLISIGLAVLTMILVSAMFVANNMANTGFRSPFAPASAADSVAIALLVLSWGVNMAGLIIGVMATVQSIHRREIPLLGLTFNVFLMIPIGIMFVRMLIRAIF